MAMRITHAKLESRSRAIGRTRLMCIAFVIVVLALVGLQIAPPRIAWASLASAALFVVLVFVHARIDRERDRRDAGARFHERALARLAGTPEKNSASPEAAIDPQHPYANDLDIIGANSIDSFLSFVRTQPGARTLAAWLLASMDPPTSEIIRGRQDAAKTLASKPELVRALWIAGAPIAEQRDKSRAFEEWLLAKEEPSISSAIAALAWVLPVITITTIVLGNVMSWPTEVTWGPYVASVVVALGLRARIGRAASAVVANEGGALAFAEAFDVAVSEKLEGETLSGLTRELTSARDGLRALRWPTLALESQQNEVIRIFASPIFMIELHAVHALERWRKKNAASAQAWFDAYGTLETLASFGLVAHDFPTLAWPEIDAEFKFEAKELGHPLVAPEKRICNDVGPLDAGHALVVTGSNMSGKSTLLRSIGVACAMAMSGAPVCAKSLVIGRLRLATSMRVSDSLAEGASRFYAELRRLKIAVDMAAVGPGVLFLLDEVLYGTNARERLIGSRATLAWLLDHGALGAVSTHDLALADLEPGTDIAARAKNVHFEEQVTGDEMTFDYKLREGVVKSSNALRLMRKLGLPVVLSTDGSDSRPDRDGE